MSSRGSRQKPFPVLTDAIASANGDLSPNQAATEALETHQKLVALCKAGGGPRGIERHVKKNKKVLVRERVSGK